MKKFFQIIGLFTLMAFSFFYTEKTVNVVKDLDNIMIQIKDEMDNYRVDAIDAIISNNNIIPGVSGKEVDINKSYKEMKKIGEYNKSLLQYKNIEPSISIKNNYDKYIISGNENNRLVTIIFKVNDNDNIDNIIKILNQNQIKANFFVDGKWFEDNNNLVINLIENNFDVGNMSYNLDYTNNNFIWMNTIITKVGNQKNSYCYTEEDNNNTLVNCSLQKSYTIKPNVVLKNNPFIELQKQLKIGSIISVDVNKKTEQDLPLMIKYISSKDMKIVTLTELITE